MFFQWQLFTQNKDCLSLALSEVILKFSESHDRYLKHSYLTSIVALRKMGMMFSTKNPKPSKNKTKTHIIDVFRMYSFMCGFILTVFYTEISRVTSCGELSCGALLSKSSKQSLLQNCQSVSQLMESQRTFWTRAHPCKYVKLFQ